MPTANVYVKHPKCAERFSPATQRRLCDFIAAKLTCDNISLDPSEVSVRLIVVDATSQLMGQVEIDIHAHAFGERVARQDELCREFADFVQKELRIDDDVRVWLVLSELGHSV